MKKKDSNTTEVKRYLLKLQDKISSSVKNIDSSTSIQVDDWRREEGGGGQSRIFKNGEIFEQAGVNFSHVSGSKLPETATKLRPELMDSNYEAMGLSLVMHPENPFIPTTHANLRYFSAENKKGNTVWWFGGGFGMRPMIDYYSLLIIPIGELLKLKPPSLKNGVLTLILLGISLNLFQTLQRRNLVIHWDSMSKESYWVFFTKIKMEKAEDW